MAMNYYSYTDILIHFGLPVNTPWHEVSQAYYASGGSKNDPITQENLMKACEFLAKNKIYNRLEKVMEE